MIRISQILGALCVFGCGSGAFASPGQRGQWLDDQTQTTAPPIAPPIHDHDQGPPGQTQPSFAGDDQRHSGPNHPGCPPSHAQPPSGGDEPQGAGDQSTTQAEKPDPWAHHPPDRQPPGPDAEDQDAEDQDAEDQDADGQDAVTQGPDDPYADDQDTDGQDVDDRGASRQGVPDQSTAPPRFSSPTNRARLGVMVMAMTPELRQAMGAPADRGVLVARIEPGSLAARAGIHVGDVVVRVGSQPVRTSADIVQALADHDSDRIQVTVIRDRRVVRLEARPANPRPAPDEDQV